MREAHFGEVPRCSARQADHRQETTPGQEEAGQEIGKWTVLIQRSVIKSLLA